MREFFDKGEGGSINLNVLRTSFMDGPFAVGGDADADVVSLEAALGRRRQPPVLEAWKSAC